MPLFNLGKKKINSKAMMHLIYETGKTASTSIFPFFDKLGIIYDEFEAKNIIAVINYELCRRELNKKNKSDVVDSVIKKVYEQYSYDLNLDTIGRNGLELVGQSINDKMNTLYADRKVYYEKELFVYKLLLNELEVNGAIIDKMYIEEFYIYIRSWFNNAIGISNSYSIEDTEEDKKKNEYIDFRF